MRHSQRKGPTGARNPAKEGPHPQSVSGLCLKGACVRRAALLDKIVPRALPHVLLRLDVARDDRALAVKQGDGPTLWQRMLSKYGLHLAGEAAHSHVILDD